MNKRKTLITMLALVCMLVVGIGFASMTKNLSISGSVNLTPKSDAFIVQFDTVSKTGGTDADTVQIKGDAKQEAEINVSSLKIKNDTVTFTLTVKNKSTENMAATLKEFSVTGDGVATGEAFSVTTTGTTGEQTLQQNGIHTITVTVTLNITPVEDVSGSFTIAFTAVPTLAA